MKRQVKEAPKAAPKPVPAAPAVAPTAAPTAAPTTVPTAPDPKMVAAGRARIKAKVGEILSAAGTHEAAGSLDALFEELGTELDNIPGARDDQTALVVEVMAEFIREEDSVPRIIRRQFLPKEKVFSSMSELLFSLEKGSTEYRKQVYNKLRMNADARKHFKLKETRAYDPVNPLGNASANRLFDRLCRERDFSALTPALRVAVESVADVSARDPVLDDQRRVLLEKVIGRLKVVEEKHKGPSFIKKMKPDKTAKAVALLVQGGLIGTAFAAGALPSGLVWMGKSALEGATGVSQADVVKAIKTGEGKALWEKLKSHNLLAEWLHTDAGMGAILKNRVGSWAKRSIPLVGPLMWGHESITNPPKEKEGEHGEHDEHGAHEEGHGEHGEAHGAHGGHEEHDPHKDEAFIKTACAEAI